MHPELQRRKGEGDLRLVEPAAELLHMRRHFAYGMGVVVDREGLASAKEFMGEVRKTVDGADESMKGVSHCTCGAGCTVIFSEVRIAR